jgi:hypothetical protein
MKKLLLIFGLLIGFAASSVAQIDIFNATVTKDGQTYTLIDSSGSDANLTVTKTVLDSAEFTRQVFDLVFSALRQSAAAQINAEVYSRQNNKYQALLSGQGLLGAFLSYVDNVVRLTGTYDVDYNNTSTVLTFGEDENLYTQGEVKVVDVLTICDNHIRVTLLTQGDEVIDLYKSGNLWWGEGVNGDFIMRLQ